MKNLLLTYLFAILVLQGIPIRLFAAGEPFKKETQSNYVKTNLNVLSASYSKRDVSSCSCGKDGAISVTTLGGRMPYTFEWTGTDGYSAGNTSSIYNLPVGYYNVKIKDADDNEFNLTGIQIAYAFTVYITNSGSLSGSCGNSGTVLLYGNAGVAPYTFSLDGVNYQCNNEFTELAPGTYTAYVRDLAGCIKTKTVTVGLAASLTMTAATVPSSTCTADGSIELFPVGGVAPFMYSLDNVTFYPDNKFLNLSSGSYACYVRDSKGCIAWKSVRVATRTALIVNTGHTATSTCTNDGTIQVNPNGGVAPYTYSLNGTTFQSANSFTGLSAGSYTVTVKDFKGCRATTNVTINTTPVVVTAYTSSASSCTAGNGKIQLFRTGGFGPYTYSLDGDHYQNSNVFNNLLPGRYQGFVKDSRACIGVLSNIIIGPANCVSLLTKGNDATKHEKAESKLKIEVNPNPSVFEFTLSLEGFKNRLLTTITVLDLQGRIVYQEESADKTQYVFGKNFTSGVYFVHVVQGNMKRDMKIIKR